MPKYELKCLTAEPGSGIDQLVAGRDKSEHSSLPLLPRQAFFSREQSACYNLRIIRFISETLIVV